ncbi:hypothetical protein FRUB_00535 [Fimbriiglobus ruber]|uniref:Uncharacterized protein n=2 Tax=Fimbriiglobus ruber TaxID=1908690 RepID=A0A225E9Y1_9BACT|nr:hypothetical protein FRUB_00535 [Fimbriiglobus ruber]
MPTPVEPSSDAPNPINPPKKPAADSTVPKTSQVIIPPAEVNPAYAPITPTVPTVGGSKTPF